MSKEAMKLALGKIKSARDCHPNAVDTLLFEAEEILEEARAKPDFWEGYVPEPVKPAQQALDKKADNARELGLDYEPAQKPVAYLCENAVGHQYFRWKKPSSTYKPIALYTSPPAQRTWVGLTTEDMATCINEPAWDLVLRKAEQILKEKNT
jgi:hypothetical protein